eukprot:1185935-Prorocentrum_minimum.AAC.2
MHAANIDHYLNLQYAPRTLLIGIQFSGLGRLWSGWSVSLGAPSTNNQRPLSYQRPLALAMLSRYILRLVEPPSSTVSTVPPCYYRKE